MRNRSDEGRSAAVFAQRRAAAGVPRWEGGVEARAFDHYSDGFVLPRRRMRVDSAAAAKGWQVPRL
jgi:hypothetical protein